jgi:hypothetical protein
MMGDLIPSASSLTYLAHIIIPPLCSWSKTTSLASIKWSDWAQLAICSASLSCDEPSSWLSRAYIKWMLSCHSINNVAYQAARTGATSGEVNYQSRKSSGRRATSFFFCTNMSSRGFMILQLRVFANAWSLSHCLSRLVGFKVTHGGWGPYILWSSSILRFKGLTGTGFSGGFSVTIGCGEGVPSGASRD